MAVIPADRVLGHVVLPAELEVLDLVLVRLGAGVDPRFRAFDGQAEGVGDDEGVAGDLALHQAHDLDGAAGARVHDHFEQGDGGDADVLEVVGVFAPGLGGGLGSVVGGGGAIQSVTLGIDELDQVFCLWGRLGGGLGA